MFHPENLLILFGFIIVMIVVVKAMFPHDDSRVLQLILSILIGAVLTHNGYGVFQ